MPRYKPSLLHMAVGLEGTGVALGLYTSSYLTFGENPPTNLWDYALAAAPAAMALVEMARIPLVKFYFTRAWLPYRVICVLGLLGATYVGIENWTFALERVVDHRLSQVWPARDEQKAAAQALVDHAAVGVEISEKRKRDEEQLQTIVDNAQRRLTELNVRAEKADATYQSNLVTMMTYCAKIAGECIRPKSAELKAANDAEHAAIQSEIVPLHQQMAEAQDRKQALSSMAETRTAEQQSLQTRKTDADAKLARIMRGNTILQVAGAFFRVDPENLNEQQLATAKLVFSLAGAVMVSIIGAVLALGHYMPKERDPLSWRPAARWLGRTVRGFVNRRRKGVIRKVIEKVEVPVEIEKKVEVPLKVIREVETHVKHVLVPVPGYVEPPKNPEAANDSAAGKFTNTIRAIAGSKP